MDFEPAPGPSKESPRVEIKKSDSQEFVWDLEKESIFQNHRDALRKLPPFNQQENEDHTKRIIREFLNKSSGGDVAGLLKSVLTEEEKKRLVDNQQLSQKFVDDLASENGSEDIFSQSLIEVSDDNETVMNEEEIDANGRVYSQKMGENRFSPEPEDSESEMERPSVTSTPCVQKKVTRFYKEKKGKRPRLPSPIASPASNNDSSFEDLPGKSHDSTYEPDDTESVISSESSFHDVKSPRAKRLRRKKRPVLNIRNVARNKPTTQDTQLIVLDDDPIEDTIPDLDNAVNTRMRSRNRQVQVLSPATINERFATSTQSDGKENEKNQENTPPETEPELEEEIAIEEAATTGTGRKNKKANPAKGKGRKKQEREEITIEPEIELEEDEDEITIEEAAEAAEAAEAKKKTKKPKPGKGILLQKLRDIVGADDDLLEEEVFSAFAFKKTVYKSDGFPEGHCPCLLQKEAELNFFQLQAIVPVEDNKDKVLEVCPRCFCIFMVAGHDSEKKNFLQMIYQVK